MDELFSCRNCIHNCGQSLNVGRGPGFCLIHNSVIERPDHTTCKYLHRKDLPHFVVEEGVKEHAAEFTGFSGLVELDSKKPLPRLEYSERYAWEKGSFDPIVNAVAQYHKTEPSWILIQAFSGGVDGRRSLVHAALVRRYMDKCDTWTSSYRLMLALMQEIDSQPKFEAHALVIRAGEDAAEVAEDALWDVIFTRLSAVQEYGWHAGLQELMWATDSLNGALSQLDWTALKPELEKMRGRWTRRVIKHAKDEKEFFPAPN